MLSNKERKLCAHPRLEIYQQDQIYFMCPLARQGDFYVPEVKETERKSRGPAEANDALVDGTGTGSGVRVGSHLEPPPGCVGLVKEPPPWLCGPVGVQTLAWQRWQKGPSSPCADLPVSRHTDPWRRGFTRFPGNADRDPALDSLHLQVQQENPWKLRSQSAGCSWRGGGIAEAAQERHCFGQAH